MATYYEKTGTYKSLENTNPTGAAKETLIDSDRKELFPQSSISQENEPEVTDLHGTDFQLTVEITLAKGIKV